MRQTKIKPISKRQAVKLSEWAEITRGRADLLRRKYGFVPCEYEPALRALHKWDGHHNDRDRNNNTLENCRCICRKHHTHVTDNNVRNVPDLLGTAPKKRAGKASPTPPRGLSGYTHGLRAFSKQDQVGK